MHCKGPTRGTRHPCIWRGKHRKPRDPLPQWLCIRKLACYQSWVGCDKVTLVFVCTQVAIRLSSSYKMKQTIRESNFTNLDEACEACWGPHLARKNMIKRNLQQPKKTLQPTTSIKQYFENQQQQRKNILQSTTTPTAPGRPADEITLCTPVKPTTLSPTLGSVPSWQLRTL